MAPFGVLQCRDCLVCEQCQLSISPKTIKTYLMSNRLKNKKFRVWIYHSKWNTWQEYAKKEKVGTFNKVQDFRGGSGSKEHACSSGEQDLIPGLGTSPGEGNGYPLQYSCLENSADRGTWQATVHSITQSDMTDWPSRHARLGILYLYFQHDPHKALYTSVIFIDKKIIRLKELLHQRSKSHNEDRNK